MPYQYQYLDNRGPAGALGQMTNTFGNITRDIMRLRAEQEYRNQMLGLRGQDIAVDRERLAAQSPYYAAQALAEQAKAQEIQAKIDAANQLGIAARGARVDTSQGPTAAAARGLNTADLYQAGARSAALAGNAAQFFTPHNVGANDVSINAFGQELAQGNIHLRPGEYYRNPLNPYPEIAPENITMNPGQVFVNTARPGMAAGGSPYPPAVGPGGMTPGVAGNLWRDMNEYADLTGTPNPMMGPVERYLMQSFQQATGGGGPVPGMPPGGGGYGGYPDPYGRPYYQQGGYPQQQVQVPQPQVQVPQGPAQGITNTVFPGGQAPQLGMQPSQRPTPKGVPSQEKGGPPDMSKLPKPKPASAQQPRPTQGAVREGPPRTLAEVHGLGREKWSKVPPQGAAQQGPPSWLPQLQGATDVVNRLGPLAPLYGLLNLGQGRGTRNIPYDQPAGPAPAPISYDAPAGPVGLPTPPRYDTPQQARAAGLQPGMTYYQPGWGIVRLRESGGVDRETFEGGR